MGIFDFLKRAGFNEKLEECRKDDRAALIDVRTPEAYREGHVPGSVILLDTRTVREYSQGYVDGFKNIPVDELRDRIGEMEKGKPIESFPPV